MERKTPLYDRHTAAGGKLVPFAGWLLPVQYSGVIAEHRAVRTGCGLFDVSHMGELLLRGPDALANLNRLMTNDFSGMADGQARYSPMCYEDGGVVDDLIVYRCSDTAWLAVVNASNIGKDRDWMTAHLAGDCTLEDLSDQTAQLALQGPGAEALLRTLTAEDWAKLPDSGAGEGLPPRLERAGRQCRSLEEFVALAKPKHWTQARMRRLLVWAYLGLTQTDRPDDPLYLRVLGFNARGQEVLRRMKERSALPIRTKPAHARQLAPEGQRLFELEARCTDLYDLCLERVPTPGREWTTGPVRMGEER